MKPLPRQFHPRHRRPRLPLRAGVVSVAVLSATLLASGSVDRSSTVDIPLAAAAPAYAFDAAPASPLGSPSASSAPVAQAPSSTQAPPAAQVPPAPKAVQPVRGLDQRQMDNAALIVKQGREQSMPDKALVVAVATAMQESDLYNVASTAVPASLKLPHDGVSADHDSVGLFQQRASQGWGSVPELMDPVHSAMLFYSALSRIEGWQRMSVTAAAQAVQRSAFPGAYQKHADRATAVVAALS